MNQESPTYSNAILDRQGIGPLLAAAVAAGAGTAAQKAWSLERPVTLIGMSHRVHIRAEGGVEPVHAALLNTGDAVVLADLNSRGGVFCGQERVTARAMQPGEWFRIGECTFQVNFVREDRHDRPAESLLAMPSLVTVMAIRGIAGRWPVPKIGTVIGRREGCGIRLDNPEVLPLQAVLSRVGQSVLIATLGTDKHIRINDASASTFVLRDGDVMTTWPIRLRVELIPVTTGFKR